MEKNFSLTPTVSIGRSKFLRRSQHKTSIRLGDIVPVYVDEVLPGDTRNFNIASLIRMSTPIAPIMDDIVMEYMAFFVPNRIVWDHWKQFMGEKDVAGYVGATEYTIPKDFVQLSNISSTSMLGYFGIPHGSNVNVAINALPIRSMFAIYNRWFRNQNVEGPVYFSKGDQGVAASSSSVVYGCPVDSDLLGSTITNASEMAAMPCFVAYKKADYFTSALPYAQKGTPVALPLGTFAPIIARDVNVPVVPGYVGISTQTKADEIGLKWSRLANNLTPAYTNDDLGDSVMDIEGTGGSLVISSTGQGPSLTNLDGGAELVGDSPTSPIVPSNLWADLSNATAATINDIRLAFATQKALEKDALYGTRYWEVLYGHFGVKSPDASLQEPEYLGGHKFYINVDQVLQTTGYANADTSELGAVGANSVTGTNASLFTKSFVEHGHIIVVAVARQKQHSYSNGINRMWLRDRRFDFYFPVFANLGNQDIKKIELFGAASSTEAFGFQEAWAEYRYKPSITSGILNPNLSSSLDYWTLTDKYTSLPTLSKSFLKETRENLARCLVTGITGPDFICDFLFNDIAVRPMPMYSIPGLVDHH